MNNENTRKLLKRFKFLNKKHLPSIDCGDGWYSLVYDMCKELKDTNPPDNFIITKIMEKCGNLKVHTKNGTMPTRIILDKYNTLSMETCDACGNDKDDQACPKCEVEEIDYSEQEDEDDQATTATPCCSGNGTCSSGGSCGCP